MSGVAYALTSWNTFAVPEWGVVWMLMHKTASTSMRVALAAHFGVEVDEGSAHYLDRFPQLTKAQAVYWKGRGFLVVGSIRHPVTRLASCWADKVAGPEYYAEFHAFPEFRPDMPFPAFVEAVAGIPDVDSEPHFRSLTFDLTDGGSVIPDVLVDQATLAADWNKVRARVAWRTRPHVWLPDLQRHRRRAWRDRIGDVPARTVELIHERYAADFAAFGYPTDVAASQALLRPTSSAAR